MPFDQGLDHSENSSTVITVEKPQKNNHVLERAILKLNFSEPLKISNHLFLEEAKRWCPRTNLCQVKLNKQYTTRLDITEVKNAKQMKRMTEHLSQMPEWAVDVEHHTEYSYAGIICLIQISTTEKNFLIDPFHLNKEIRRDLKPLMESGNYVKVMHESYNELRWLQRDFNIFVWPVVDTQVIYRKIKTIQNVEHFHSNININCLILNYFPFVEIPEKDQSQADFRIRPLTDELQYFAVLGSAFLLPILCALRSDLENNSCGTEFDSLIKNCIEYMARKFLYRGKVHTSVEEDIERFKIKSSTEMSTFRALHSWRNDKAKVLDENPNQILPVANLVAISRIKNPADILVIHKFIPRSAIFISKLDVTKIKEIIDSGQYKSMTPEEAFCPCSTCGEFSHPPSFWPAKKQRCDSQGRLFSKNWQEHITENVNMGANDIENATNLQDKNNLTNVINQFSFSRSNQLGLYAFTLTELNWIAVEIKTCIINVKKVLKCPSCSITIEKAVICKCKCDFQSVLCAGCWSSRCPVCQIVTSEDPYSFESVDNILGRCESFLEALQENDSENLFMAIVDFLVNCEIELMCSYCFMHLEKTMVIPLKGNCRAQCCRICYQLFIEQCVEQVEPIPLDLFDQICDKFSPLLAKLLLYCQQNKSPEYKDSFGVYGKASEFREKALGNSAASCEGKKSFENENLIINDTRGKDETIQSKMPFSQQVGDLSAQLVECNQ